MAARLKTKRLAILEEEKAAAEAAAEAAEAEAEALACDKEPGDGATASVDTAMGAGGSAALSGWRRAVARLAGVASLASPKSEEPGADAQDEARRRRSVIWQRASGSRSDGPQDSVNAGGST